MKKVLTLLLLLLSNILPAQDFKEAMLAMRKQYEGLQSLHLAMAVKVFENKNATAPFYTMDVDIKMAEEKYLYKYGNNDMLLNDKYLIMVDHGTKEIILTKRDHNSEKELKKDFQFNLDSIMTAYEAAEYLGTNNGVHHYKLIHKKGIVKQINMFINESNNFLKKMTYEYTSKQFVTIDFKDFEKDLLIHSGVFAEQNYVTENKNTFSPSAGYKSYKVHSPEIQ